MKQPNPIKLAYGDSVYRKYQVELRKRSGNKEKPSFGDRYIALSNALKPEEGEFCPKAGPIG
jgi:hypothetical protein